MSVVRAAGIRAGEGRILALVTLMFAALEMGRGFGEVGVDTLVISRFGAGILPYLFICLGATSLVTALAYGAALGRMSRTPLLVGFLLGASGLLLLGRALIAGGAADVVPVIWLVTYAAGAIAVTISWTVAGSVFDARQAKRLFPLCTGAAIAGSFVGTLASGPVAKTAGTELLVVLEAILLAIVAILIASIARSGQLRTPVRRRGRSVVGDLRVGFDEVARSPLFRLVAVAYVLFSILFFSVTYPFLQSASTTFPAEADLATAIGLLSAAVTATSFVVSLTLANRVYARFGVAGAALVLPVVYVAGFGLWLVSFSFATAALVRFTQQVAQRGLSNAAWSAFFNVIPTERRAQVLAFIDGVPGQIGTILSGFLLLGAGRLFATDQVFWLGVIAAAILAVVVAAIRRRYGASLLTTLRAGLGEQVLEGGPGLEALKGDPQVAAALSVAMQAPEPATRRMAVTVLARTSTAESMAALVAAVDDEDAGVRVAALDGLAACQPDPAAVGRLAARFADPDPRVRAAAIRAVARADGSALETLAVPLATDADPIVRATAEAALAAQRWASGGPPNEIAGLLADPAAELRQAAIAAIAGARPALVESSAATLVPALIDALDDDSARVRNTAAAVMSHRPVVSDGLVTVLSTGSPRARDAALLALLGHGPAVRDQLIAWAEPQIARATAYRSARVVVQSSIAGSSRASQSAAFLTSVLAHRERMLINQALGALAILGVPEARGLLRRCLRSNDPETRAQALEALDSIGDRRLGGAVVRLLDADQAAGPRSAATVLAALADDEDPWVASLARWTLADEGGQVSMPDTGRTMSDIDTMLTLRAVPLFSELEPEDLQRIARASVERLYPAGSALMHENDLDDELLVIVDGTVRVVRPEPDGSERVIRRFGAGDHIGELAVLRERPRAASVIADGGDVRTLVIGGEGLRAILRERPDAAMAMLATLAERISAQ